MRTQWKYDALVVSVADVADIVRIYAGTVPVPVPACTLWYVPRGTSLHLSQN
jgi:hypothetical protein